MQRFRDIEDDLVMPRDGTLDREGSLGGGGGGGGGGGSGSGWRADEVGFGPASSPQRVVDHARAAELRESFDARDRGSFDREGSYKGGFSGAASPGRDAAIAIWGAQVSRA